jgi:ATPase subunit of ABC transporter with duplicated ATPase domains
MTVKDLVFSYAPGEPVLINGFSIAVGRRDRIGIIGRNGKVRRPC